MDKKCFVIMPFTKTVDTRDEKYWDSFFNVLRRIMEEKNFTCERSEVGPYKLFSNIVKNIETSDIVIAVLTDFNANVWYELGIRHTLKKGTIMLLQEGQKAPFDISDFGIIFYKDTIALEEYIKKPIEEYLDKLDKDSCDSPVISALNDKAYHNLEKRLEEMQRLIWQLVSESRDGNKAGKTKDIIKRILWVDDLPNNNKNVIDLFRDRGIQFDMVLTTEEGVRLYQSASYDLIITDMGRGKESDAGLNLLRKLKLLKCQIPVIVYTTHKSIDRYGEEALRLGAYAVTNKAVKLIPIISSILGL